MPAHPPPTPNHRDRGRPMAGILGRLCRLALVLASASSLAPSTPPARSWDGPTQGPAAQPGKTVVFIGADSRNGGVTSAFRGFEAAAARLGWKASFQDGGGDPATQKELLRKAVAARPDGIVIGGFDAAGHPALAASARKAGIVLVGWHAAARPGPTAELFVNVATSSESVGGMAVDFIAWNARKGGKRAGIVVLTDNHFAVAKAKVQAMLKAAARRKASECSILEVLDIPIAQAGELVPRTVPLLARRWGSRWTYTLAINDVYFDNINYPLVSARRPDILNVSAGDGSPLALERIRSGLSQQAATVAEPLKLQGYQLADELNRAFAGARPSGYRTSPVLITRDRLEEAGSRPPAEAMDFEAAYARIWAGPSH